MSARKREVTVRLVGLERAIRVDPLKVRCAFTVGLMARQGAEEISEGLTPAPRLRCVTESHADGE
jgi:hypothetical protein